MQVRCVRAFGQLKPGDLAEVPDGAAVDPEHFEPVQAAAPPPLPPAPPLLPPPPAPAAPAPAPASEGM